MGIYTRYKRPGGLRSLVELLETTGPKKRERMLELGNSEDPEFTRIALSYTFTFDEILTLGDLEFCEVMAESQPQVIGLAVQGLGPEVTARVLRSVKPAIAAAVREALDSPGSKTDISGARYKMITYARSAEKKGLLRVKRIPESL